MQQQIKKNTAIIYCRLSRVPDAARGVMSLDSQEFSIKTFLTEHNLGVYSILKNTGSAFKSLQTDIKNLLKSCKNKVLVVYEANRLSRNIFNFKDIYEICKKNNHHIAIVNMNTIYDIRISSNYKLLYDLIVYAEKESYDMGQRISRTFRYKKAREPLWGMMRNKDDRIVENPHERRINLLVRLLATKFSSVAHIRELIDELSPLSDKPPFELIEYNGRVLDCSLMPESMDAKNIIDTLKVYGIRRRKRLNWTRQEITDIIKHINPQKPAVDLDVLCNDFTSVVSSTELNRTPTSSGWTCIWYVPSVGLPPNVTLPEGMTLPTTACEIYIPK